MTKALVDYKNLAYYDHKIKDYIDGLFKDLTGFSFLKDDLVAFNDSLKAELSETYQIITAENLQLDNYNSEIEYNETLVTFGYVSVLTSSVLAISDTDWAVPTVSAADSTITVAISPNTGATRRESVIAVKNGYMTVYHTIIQHASEEGGVMELEYIVSTESGQQYINTGYGIGLSPKDFKIEIKGAMDYATPTQTGCFFGARENTNTYRFDFCRNSTKLFRVTCGTVTDAKKSVAFNVAQFTGINTFLIDGRNSVVTNNGTKSYPFEFEDFALRQSLWLFGENTGNAINGNFYENKAIFYCKFWYRDKLVREYYPVLDINDKPCMYETITKQFLYNANPNGKDFLTPEEYIISNALSLGIDDDTREDEDLVNLN